MTCTFEFKARARETAKRIMAGKPKPLFISEAIHVEGSVYISSVGRKAA